MLLKAAINGGRSPEEHRAVPRTIQEIVQASLGATAAGADVVHAHVITEDGSQTIHPDYVGEWVRAMRAADPSVVIGTTTGLWTVNSHRERMSYLRAWPTDALPDFASVAFCEEGASEAASLVIERGMILESAVWSVEDVPALLASETLDRNVRILIEPETQDIDLAVAQCREIAKMLRDAGVHAPFLYHGFDATVWPIVEAAIEDGCEARIGFEDGVILHDGSTPRDNADLVRAVRDLERRRTC